MHESPGCVAGLPRGNSAENEPLGGSRRRRRRRVGHGLHPGNTPWKHTKSPGRPGLFCAYEYRPDRLLTGWRIRLASTHIEGRSNAEFVPAIRVDNFGARAT
jgi:hypothetical protein